MLSTYDRLGFGEFVGGTGSTPMSRGCLAVRGCIVGILVIGTYIYHPDVIANAMQINANRIQTCITYYSKVDYIYNLYMCHSVPSCYRL